MENLIFSLNATVPIFLLMVLGLFFQKIGRISESFAMEMNRFVFLIPLPVMVFEDLATVKFEAIWDMKFVLFCFFVTVASIGLVTGISFLWKDKGIQGEFIQSSYRSSAALLGIAFIQNIYGNAGMAPLMIIGSVPLYNIMAVIALSFFQPERKGMDKALIKKTARGIVTNPIIASPMGLMSMGATFEFNKAFKKLKPAITATFFKLIGFAAIFLPMAVGLGFRNEELVAILVMLGSATTVSCFVMAKNMGHEGVLSSSVVMLTTMFSAFTLTMWLFILKSFQLI